MFLRLFPLALQIPLWTWAYGQLTFEEIARRYTKRTSTGVHLPIIGMPTNRLRARGLGAVVGLGDIQDIVYSALVTVGHVTTPLVVDTGSSDLWVLSDTCTFGCNGSTTLYPQASFQSSGIGVVLAYGDSRTGTFASGLIGFDKIGLGNITLNNQSFAAINQTNTTVTQDGTAGILGLGFPINSEIWTQIFLRMAKVIPPQRRGWEMLPLDNFLVPSPDQNSRRYGFPDISGLLGLKSDEPHPQTRQAISDDFLKAIFSSWSTIGPFVPRLVSQGALTHPLISVTLQRTTMDVGGNLGMLSIGELPTGVKTSDLTWVPLRNYTAALGGIPAPADSPTEVYPLSWEVMIDNVYLDGEKLPASSLAPSSIGVSALIDTGNSLIRGPVDVVSYVYNKLGDNGLFKCAEPHNLSFEIGGKIFPVDPRDFAAQAYINNVDLCYPNLVPTDTPKIGGYLFSWSLGIPFLKGVLSSYYFGNLSYPSRDRPKIGFLSTVPGNASDLMKAAADAAQNSGNFPATSQPAPTGSPTPVHTNSQPQATQRKSSAICDRGCVSKSFLLTQLYLIIFALFIAT